MGAIHIDGQTHLGIDGSPEGLDCCFYLNGRFQPSEYTEFKKYLVIWKGPFKLRKGDSYAVRGTPNNIKDLPVIFDPIDEVGYFTISADGWWAFNGEPGVYCKEGDRIKIERIK